MATAHPFSTAPLFRYADGRLPNSLALAYTLAGYVGGIALLFSPSVWLNAVGTVVLGHAMLIAAYLIHEFAHGTIFARPEHNARAAVLCAWLSGSCYAPFQELRKKHMRHHVDRADVVTFDTKVFLKRCPASLIKLVEGLEWAYVPAVELLMHAYVIALPFITDVPAHRTRRGQVLALLAVRGVLFAGLGWLSLKALLLYGLAWLLMVSVLRFADAYQHTYDVFADLAGGKLDDGKHRDRAYEQQNTYSNTVSLRWPALNLLLLNFAYHNAHHDKPAAPWYRLPRLNAELYQGDDTQVIPMRALLGSFHRHRVRRVLDDDYGVVGQGPHKANAFHGAIGVSFLTAI
jgi:fatty acid desaturase